jgi:hypothetical protein
MASPSQEASVPSAHVDPTGADAYIKRLRYFTLTLTLTLALALHHTLHPAQYEALNIAPAPCREECDNKRKDNVRLLQDLQRCIKSQNKFSRKESVWQHEKEVMQAQHMAEAAALRGEMQAAREVRCPSMLPGRNGHNHLVACTHSTRPAHCRQHAYASMSPQQSVTSFWLQC